MKRDGGYALLVAVVGIAAFAYVAFEAMEQSRGVIASAEGDFTRARLSADADAGLALAIQGLMAEENDASHGAWPIDGRTQTVSFGSSVLQIAVEDERGKVDLSSLTESQARELFEAAGASGARLDELTDALDDWQDEDDVPRAHGAEAPAYLMKGIHPRNAPVQTVGELMNLKGMDPYLFARLAPAVTVFFGNSGGFDQTTASPLAMRVMSDASIDTPEILEQEREAEGEVPAFGDTAEPESLIGRTLTVRVTVRRADGGTLQQATIVELTGNPSQPYWVRYRD